MEAAYHEEAFNCSSIDFDHCYDLPFPPQSKNDDEVLEIPLSPDSRKYQLKMSLLEEKFHEIESSNQLLRNRLNQVQKAIMEEERLKAILLNTLESRGDKYYKAKLDFPPPIEMPKPQPSAEDVEREKRKRERKERDRIREKARKQAKREADKKAKLQAEVAMQHNENMESTDPVHSSPVLQA